MGILGGFGTNTYSSSKKMDYKHNSQQKRKIHAHCTLVPCMDSPHRRRHNHRQQHLRMGTRMGNTRTLPLLGTNDNILRNRGFIKLPYRSSNWHSCFDFPKKKWHTNNSFGLPTKQTNAQITLTKTQKTRKDKNWAIHSEKVTS